MRRVDIKKILADPGMREVLLEGAVSFICQVCREAEEVDRLGNVPDAPICPPPIQKGSWYDRLLREHDGRIKALEKRLKGWPERLFELATRVEELENDED